MVELRWRGDSTLTQQTDEPATHEVDLRSNWQMVRPRFPAAQRDGQLHRQNGGLGGGTLESQGEEHREQLLCKHTSQVIMEAIR